MFDTLAEFLFWPLNVSVKKDTMPLAWGGAKPSHPERGPEMRVSTSCLYGCGRQHAHGCSTYI